MMKKGIITGLIVLAFPLLGFTAPNNYAPQSVGAGNPELHIKTDGMMTLKSGRVDQVVGNTFYLGVMWGTLPMRFTMKTDARTIVTKRYGGSAAVHQINVGNYLDVEGEFFVGSDFFGVQALRVKDWSLQEESAAFSGVVIEATPDERLMLMTLTRQTIEIRPATSSAARVTKGSVVIPFGRLKRGDAVLSASGVFDYTKNLLTAENIVVYQNKADFLPHNFEGTLERIISVEAPASIIVAVKGVPHTVKIPPLAVILKKNRSPGELARFVVGDTVRFYGGIREEERTLNDILVVDAEVVRNLNL